MMIKFEVSDSIERSFRVSILGEAVVGKTCFVRRLIDDRFDDHYSVTIGMDFHTKTFQINDAFIKLQIWDTAGQENYRAITRSFFNKSHAIVLMFDITNRATFEALPTWIADIKGNANQGTLIFLVGNQIDAVQEVSGLRVTTAEEAQRLVKQNDLHSYSEVSARTGENVRDTMEKVARVLWNEVSESQVSILLAPHTKKKKKCC